MTVVFIAAGTNCAEEAVQALCFVPLRALEPQNLVLDLGRHKVVAQPLQQCICMLLWRRLSSRMNWAAADDVGMPYQNKLMHIAC